jgi:hypothetical protein
LEGKDPIEAAAIYRSLNSLFTASFFHILEISAIYYYTVRGFYINEIKFTIFSHWIYVYAGNKEGYIEIVDIAYPTFMDINTTP